MASWEAVGTAVDEKRRMLQMSIQDLADRAGISVTAVRNFIRATKPDYSDKTKWGICRALGWTPDSLDRIQRGEPPVDAPDTVPIVARALPAARMIDPEGLTDEDFQILERLAQDLRDLRRKNGQ